MRLLGCKRERNDFLKEAGMPEYVGSTIEDTAETGPRTTHEDLRVEQCDAIQVAIRGLDVVFVMLMTPSAVEWRRKHPSPARRGAHMYPDTFLEGVAMGQQDPDALKELSAALDGLYTPSWRRMLKGFLVDLGDAWQLSDDMQEDGLTVAVRMVATE